MTAIEYYERGNEFRKLAKFKEAMDCFIEAISLDPNSPAVYARQMLEEQYAFYCKDYYNP